MRYRVLMTGLLLALLAGALGYSLALAAPSDLALDDLTLCRVVRGDGSFEAQPYGVYGPGQRVWARVQIAGFARDGDSVDLELTMEVQTPDGQVKYRGVVIDGKRAVPVDRDRVYAVATYDTSTEMPEGEYTLRLSLHDRTADARAKAEVAFSIGSKEAVATGVAVELKGQNLAAELTVHGVTLANEIAGHPAPRGQLFLVVETSWQNLLVDQVYGVTLDKLAFVTIDEQLDHAYVDLGRYLDGALPSMLLIDPGQRTRGFLSFVVPAKFTSAALRYRDDMIGKGDIIIPLIDLEAGDQLTFPDPGTGPALTAPEGAGTGGESETPGAPAGGSGEIAFSEVEPNDGRNQANQLPSVNSMIIEGTIEKKGDVDGYMLTVTDSEPRLWTFSLSAVPDEDLTLDIHIDGGGRVYVDNGGLGEDEFTQNVGLPAGTHRVMVTGKQGANPDAGYILAVRGTRPVQATEEAEFNNRKEAANALKLGETTKGWIGYRGDGDWYLLHLDEATALAVTLTPPRSANLWLGLHDANGRFVLSLNLGQRGEVERQAFELAARETTTWWSRAT